MEREYASLIRNETWELVPANEVEVKVIPGLWTYKLKPNGLSLFKARFCAAPRGDYCGGYDTFAPVIRSDSLRILLALAAANGWETHQADVCTAFLYAPVQGDVYVRQPKGFESYGPRGERMVLKLNRSLYGLPQSPRNFNNLMNKFLLEKGMTQSKSDPCLYFNHSDEGSIFLALYVDDLVLTGSNTTGVHSLKNDLFSRFEMKDLGEVSECIGYQVTSSVSSSNSEWPTVSQRLLRLSRAYVFPKTLISLGGSAEDGDRPI
jgi:hypothetical protein